MHPLRQQRFAIVTSRPNRLLHALHYAGHVLKRLANWHPHPFRW